MKHTKQNKQSVLRDLVFRYEVGLQRGVAPFFEETEFASLIHFFEKEGHHEKALKVVSEAIQFFPLNGQFYLTKAKLVLEQNQVKEALSLLNRAESFNVSALKVDFHRGVAYRIDQKHEQAKDLFENLKAQTSLHNRKLLSQIHYQEARIHEAEDNFHQMYFSLKSALKENPGNLKALERFWLAVEICRKHEESIVLHHFILDHDPYNYRAWFNLGHAYYSTNDYENAIRSFEYAFLINDKFELAYRDYAELCFEVRQYDKALKCYLELSKHFHADMDILVKIGQCLQQLGNLEKAKIYFFRALGLDQRNDEVYFYLAECYTQEGHFGSAVHFYNQAIKLDPNREDYKFALAKNHQRLNNSLKAKLLFEQAIELAPEQVEYWTAYARLQFDAGNLEEAMDILTMAENNSFGAEIYFCKAVILFKSNKRKAAFYAMEEGFSYDYNLHTIIYDWLPELKQDTKLSKMIDYFKGE